MTGVPKAPPGFVAGAPKAAEAATPNGPGVNPPAGVVGTISPGNQRKKTALTKGVW